MAAAAAPPGGPLWGFHGGLSIFAVNKRGSILGRGIVQHGRPLVFTPFFRLPAAGLHQAAVGYAGNAAGEQHCFCFFIWGFVSAWTIRPKSLSGPQIRKLAGDDV